MTLKNTHKIIIPGTTVHNSLLLFAVFLYNQGDRRNASTRLLSFRKSHEALVQAKRRDIDPEVNLLKKVC